MNDADDVAVDRIRRRMIEIADELQSLAADDFSARHALNVEADGLRRQLQSLVADEVGTLAAWAERAGRKGSHTEDVEAAKAAIVSPGEGGQV